MKTRQISIFIENKTGRLCEVIQMLGANGVNIRALSLADTSEFGIIRMIVNDPERAKNLLKENSFSAAINDVVGIEVPDKAGGLAELLLTLAKGLVNVEYVYAFINRAAANAIMIFRFSDTDKALEILNREKVRVLKESELLGL